MNEWIIARKGAMMGWTSYHVDGKINRKNECGRVYNGETEKYIWKVLKSAMIGSTYYAAVKKTDKGTGESKVFAGVCLTAVDNSDWYNFSYKDMDESVGPFESKCPNSILDLLTETEYEYANEWRERCRTYNAKPKLGKLPIGTVIEFALNGKTYRATKQHPAYQFKTPFWLTEDGRYIKKKQIPEDFKVIKEVITK